MINWDHYRVELQVRENLAAGIPATEDMQAGMLKARATRWLKEIEAGRAAPPEEGSVEEETLRQIEETKGQVDVQGEEGKGLCVFKRDDVGLYLEPRQVKAMLREAAVGLGLTKRPPLGCKQDIREYCRVQPWGWVKGQQDRLYLLDDDYRPVKQADGREERPIRVQTPQGERSSVKRVDFVTRRRLRFEVLYLASRGSRPTKDEVADMLEVGENLGLGSDRSQGAGQYDVVKFEVVKVFPHPPVGKAAKGKKAEGDEAEAE